MTVEIVDTSVVDLPTALLAIGAFLALNRWHGKPTVVYVVLGCGLIGSALNSADWSDACHCFPCKAG